MGNTLQDEICKVGCPEFSNKNIVNMGKIVLPPFGMVPLYKNQITNQYFFREECEYLLPSLQSRQLQRSQGIIESLRQLNNKCPHLIHILKIEPQQKKLNCSGKNKCFVYFQYIQISLKDLIQNRKATFSELQIYRIFNSLLVAVKHLNEKESYHGDINPQFIYVDEKSVHKYKIFDPVYFNPTKTGYYRAQNESAYCAPQILLNLNQKRTFPLYNHYVCDTYSIGLVIIYCMTLINPSIAYRIDKKQIDSYYIESLLRIGLKNGFSQKLINCIRECLMSKNRPTVTQILEHYKFLNVNFQNEDFKLSLRKA